MAVSGFIKKFPFIGDSKKFYFSTMVNYEKLPNGFLVIKHPYFPINDLS